MPGRRSRLANTVKHRSRSPSLLLWRTLPRHHSPPLRSFVRNSRDASATANGVSTISLQLKGASRILFSTGLLAPNLLVKPALFKWELGFAASRCLGEQPQRVGGFSTSLLLKFRNPIGHSINHIARRFPSGVRLCLNDWAGFFALLYDSNCFLLRHC